MINSDHFEEFLFQKYPTASFSRTQAGNFVKVHFDKTNKPFSLLTFLVLFMFGGFPAFLYAISKHFEKDVFDTYSFQIDNDFSINKANSKYKGDEKFINQYYRYILENVKNPSKNIKVTLTFDDFIDQFGWWIAGGIAFMFMSILSL